MTPEDYQTFTLYERTIIDLHIELLKELKSLRTIVDDIRQAAESI